MALIASDFGVMRLHDHQMARIASGCVRQEARLRGRADAAMLEAVMPPPGPTTRIVVSGPPGESVVRVEHMDYFPRRWP